MKGMKKEVKHFLEIKGEEGVDIDAFLKIEGFLNFCYKNEAQHQNVFLTALSCQGTFITL